MIEFILYIVSIIIVVIVLIISLVCKLVVGRKTIKSAGLDNSVNLFHGSYKKLDEIRPRDSLLTDRPAVFATSSYIDAVIFSAQWTDYDFAMWQNSHIDNKIHLDEQYPGAFNKLNRIGYIHTVDSANFKPLRTAGSSIGLPTEYISHDVVYPLTCTEVNILEYLKSQEKIAMREFTDVVSHRDKVEQRKISADVVCFIGADEFTPAIMDQIYEIEKLDSNYKVEFTTRIDMDNLGKGKKHRGQKLSYQYILLGDDIVGGVQFTTSAPKYYLKQNHADLINHFNNRKTTRDEFRKYLTNRKKQFPDWKQVTIDELKKLLSDS